MSIPQSRGSRAAGAQSGCQTRPTEIPSPTSRSQLVGSAVETLSTTISSHSPIAVPQPAHSGGGISSIRQANSHPDATASVLTTRMGAALTMEARPRRLQRVLGSARCVPLRGAREGVRTPMERILSMRSVRFEGPAMTRRARGSLSAAGISVMERHASTSWGEQRQDYLVIVDARDRDDAVARVRAAISPHGAYSGFSADPH